MHVKGRVRAAYKSAEAQKGVPIGAYFVNTLKI